MATETLYSKANIAYSDKCFDKGMAELGSLKPRGAKLAPNWRVAGARSDSQPTDKIAKVGGRVLEGIMAIPAGYLGNSKVLRYLVSVGLASEYAEKATQMNSDGKWFSARGDLSADALSQAIRSGIEIKAEELEGNFVRIPLKSLGKDARAIALYGGWNGDNTLRMQIAENHAKWLTQFEPVEKEGIRLFVPSDEEVKDVGKPVDAQIWSAGSGYGFNLRGNDRSLDVDAGVFGVLD